MKMNTVVVCLLLAVLPGPWTGEIYATQSTNALKDEVKGALKKMSAPLMDPVSKNDVKAIQAVIDHIVSGAQKDGRPIRFGIGILDREGVAVAGRYVVGEFKVEDFSNYRFVTRAYKQKKIIQDRLYLRGGSELLIVCIPLVQRRDVIGALVLGFNASELEKDYGLNTGQFMALDFNK